MQGLQARPLAARQPLLRRPAPCRPRLAPQRAVVVRAAASMGGAAEDPYQVSPDGSRAGQPSLTQNCKCLSPCLLTGWPLALQVLGVPRNADSTTVQRAYKKKLSEVKGDEAATQRIEAAHTSIMMGALTSRLKVRERARAAAAAVRSCRWSKVSRPNRPCMPAGRHPSPTPARPQKHVFKRPAHTAHHPQTARPHKCLCPQGDVKVDKSILYADKARYFPWRPRLYLAPNKLVLYQGIAQVRLSSLVYALG